MNVYPTRRAAALGTVIIASLSLYLLARASVIVALLGLLSALVLGLSHGEAVQASRDLPRVAVRRVHRERGGEGAAMSVQLVLEAPRGWRPRAPYFELEDYTPERLRAENPRGRIVPALGENSFSYTARPAPGFHMLEAVRVSTGDSLGLFQAHRTIPARTSVSVMPLSLGELLLTGTSRGLAEPVVSRTRGFSMEFFQLREYVPGDDVRLISWTATARAGKPMVREGVEEARSDLALLIDLSLPAWPGTPGEAAADWIMRTALTLAEAAVRSGGRVHYTILRGEVWESWGPLRGREAVDHLRFRLSVAGPSTARRRFALEPSVRRFLSSIPHGVLPVLLVGSAVNPDTLVRALEGSPPRCGLVIAIVSPSGPTRLEKVARIVDRELSRVLAERLTSIGARVFHVTGPGGVTALAGEVMVLLGRGVCPHPGLGVAGR